MPWAINLRSLVLKEMSSEGHYYCCYISYCNRKKVGMSFSKTHFPCSGLISEIWEQRLFSIILHLH